MRMLAMFTMLICLTMLVGADEDFKPGDTVTYRSYSGEEVQTVATFTVTETEDGGRKIIGANKAAGDQPSTVTKYTTVYAPCGAVKSHRFSDVYPDSSTRDVEVSFEPGKAEITMIMGGVEQTDTIELPEEWILSDNNVIAHFAMIVESYTPDMERKEGQMFIPQARVIIDYALEPVGEAKYEVGGKEIACHHYKFTIAGRYEINFFVTDGKLIALEQSGFRTVLDL